MELPKNAGDQFKPNKDEGKTLKEVTNEKKSEIKEAIRSAQEEIKSRLGDDADVHFPDSFDKDLLSPSLDWRSLLENFFIESEKTSYTYTKPRQRELAAGYYAPSRKKEESTLDIVLAIDTSGSITNDMIAIFLSEILGIMEAANSITLRVLFWNTKVYRDITYNTEEEDVDSIKDRLFSNVTPGGTTFNSIKDHLDSSNTDEINGFIVFTDGQFYDGKEAEELDIPDAQNNLVLLTPGGNTYPLDKYYAGEIYKIDVYSK